MSNVTPFQPKLDEARRLADLTAKYRAIEAAAKALLEAAKLRDHHRGR